MAWVHCFEVGTAMVDGHEMRGTALQVDLERGLVMFQPMGSHTLRKKLEVPLSHFWPTDRVAFAKHLRPRNIGK